MICSPGRDRPFHAGSPKSNPLSARRILRRVRKRWGEAPRARSPAGVAENATRIFRRSRCWPCEWARSRRGFGRHLHRLNDLRIGRTATEVAGQIVADVIVARIWMLFEQLMRHENEPGGTVAALEGPGVDEGLLHRRQLPVGVERFDRGDALAVDPNGEIEATRDRLAVNQNRATAA